MGLLGRVRGKLRGIRNEIRGRSGTNGVSHAPVQNGARTNGVTHPEESGDLRSNSVPTPSSRTAAPAAEAVAEVAPVEVVKTPEPQEVEVGPVDEATPEAEVAESAEADDVAEAAPVAEEPVEEVPEQEASDADLSTEEEEKAKFRGGSKVAADGSSNSVATSQFSSFAAAAAAAARGGTGQALYADTDSTDVAAYAARAAALGRTGAELGGEGINEGENGTFWGPVDNESARSKAEGQVLDIDQDECISCGTCVENTDTVFYLPVDEGSTAYVLKQEGPMDLVQDAIEACPVTCISWVAPGEEWVSAD